MSLLETTKWETHTLTKIYQLFLHEHDSEMCCSKMTYFFYPLLPYVGFGNIYTLIFLIAGKVLVSNGMKRLDKGFFLFMFLYEFRHNKNMHPFIY